MKCPILLTILIPSQGRIQSWILGGFYCIFYVKRLLILLPVVENIAIRGHTPTPTLDPLLFPMTLGFNFSLKVPLEQQNTVFWNETLYKLISSEMTNQVEAQQNCGKTTYNNYLLGPGCADGGVWGALHLPIRELVTVFSVTFCSLSRVGQLVKMHRNRKSHRTSLIGPLDLCDGNIIGL